jgi:beta-galactosidase
MRTLIHWKLAVWGLALAVVTVVIGAPTVPITKSFRQGATPRTVIDFDGEWRFSRGDSPTATMPGFDDSEWQEVMLPHDWSIAGPFGPENASGTGYAPGGIGWYRKTFRLDALIRNREVRIEFDGIYDHSQVWINGHFIGSRPFGYIGFEYDLTPYLKWGSADNVIAVRVDHSRFADSRWYTGSGIHRHVRLQITDPVRIAQWGTWIATPEITKDAAQVRVEITVESRRAVKGECSVESEILAPSGESVAMLSTEFQWSGETNRVITQTIQIRQPQLWTLEAPRLYTLRSRVQQQGRTIDETLTPFGIRSLRFDADEGFFLNGQPLKLKGVCVHHDAGCLGAAVPEKVWERRLRALKELGVNAIRTSHNPPSPEFLDLCDRLGLLVKDEAFDEFTPAKNKWVSGRNDGLPSRFGYAEDFERWSVRDVQDMVRRDRNHPSVIMWSIGNEIDYPNDPFSHPVLGGEYRPEHPSATNLVRHARPLIAAVKELDSTRPVTMALAHITMSDAVGLGELLDVVGYNYQESHYAADRKTFPRRFIFGSETGHQFGDWAAVKTNRFVAGQFLWTGIDYLGEANRWPHHGSSAGLLDLCGFKKPIAAFRQSLWSDQPMVALAVSPAGGGDPGRRGRTRGEERWNWASNSTVSVHCFTTCSEVELTLNGRGMGTKRKADAVEGVITWSLPFEPGILQAVGRQEGRAVAEFTLKTAGAPARIELVPDVTRLAADGRDVCHVEFRVVDADGVRVPDARNAVTFQLEGQGRILGVENGDLNTPPDYNAPEHRALRGRGLAILQSTKVAGTMTLKASSPGLESAVLTLTVNQQ